MTSHSNAIEVGEELLLFLSGDFAKEGERILVCLMACRPKAAREDKRPC